MFRALVDVERRDVDELTRPSFKRLFARLSGEFESRLGHEIIEAQEAELRYAEQAQHVAALEREIAEVEGELEALGDVEAGYQSALEQKAALLSELGSAASEEVDDALLRLGKVRAEKKEFDEVIDLGTRALEAIDEAREGAQRADRLLPLAVDSRQERAAEFARRDHLDASAQAIARARALLHRFQGELLDVARDGGVDFAAMMPKPGATVMLLARELDELELALSSVYIRVREVLGPIEARQRELVDAENAAFATFEALVRNA